MGITSSFNRDIVQHRFDAFLQEVEKLQIEMMQELGEKCVTEMRLNKGYTMQTGALLSSSGYSVFKDGVAIHTAFEAAIDMPVAAFINALSTYDISAYEQFERVYPTLTAGSVFNPFLGFDVV